MGALFRSHVELVVQLPFCTAVMSAAVAAEQRHKQKIKAFTRFFIAVGSLNKTHIVQAYALSIKIYTNNRGKPLA
jgi:hypothetical protein